MYYHFTVIFEIYQHRLSTPLRLTHKYLTPLKGLTPSPKPRLRLGSTVRLSTFIPDGSQPRTVKETDAKLGIRFSLSCDFVFFEGELNIDGAFNREDDEGWSVGVCGLDDGTGEEATGSSVAVAGRDFLYVVFFFFFFFVLCFEGPADASGF